MIFFMWPIVTGNLHGTINRRSTLATVWSAEPAARRNCCRAGALARRSFGEGGSLPPDGKRSACPTTTLLHSENPTAPRNLCASYGWVAQSAEQWTENPRVGGSIPPPAKASFSRVKQCGNRAFFSHFPKCPEVKKYRCSVLRTNVRLKLASRRRATRS